VPPDSENAHMVRFEPIPPHNSDTSIPLCRFASRYEPGIWHGHGPGIAPYSSKRTKRAWCRGSPVTVGINIVGSANAGKSRLINTLKRVKVRRRNPPFHLRAQAHWQVSTVTSKLTSRKLRDLGRMDQPPVRQHRD
jgi:hypothetical protein